MKKSPTTEELIERGFASKNGKLEILFIYPATTVASRVAPKLRKNGKLQEEDIGEVGGKTIPLGIASLAAYLREKGIGVGVLDCDALDLEIEKVNEIIEKKDPAIIGFSVTTYGLSTALELVKGVRKKFPKKLIVCGGAHARDAEEKTSEIGFFDIFDIVTYGTDGEPIIHDVIQKYSKKNFDRNSFLQDFALLENIKGIIFRKKILLLEPLLEN